MARVATEKYVFGDNTGARWHWYLSGEEKKGEWPDKRKVRFQDKASRMMRTGEPKNLEFNFNYDLSD